MNTQTKTKHKFNFVDAIIIYLLLVIAALLAFIFLFKGPSALSGIAIGKGERTHIYYAVEFNNVKDEMKDNVHPGDPFNYGVKNINLGKVVGVYAGDCEFVGVNDDGVAVAGNYPGRISLMVIVEADANYNTYGYSIESFEFQIGAEIQARTNNFSGIGYCIGLKTVESDADKDAFVQDMKERIYYAEPPQIYYAVEFPHVNEAAKNSIKQGDKLIDTDTKAEIGQVVAIYPGDSESVGIAENGNAVAGTNPGYISLTVIVESTAVNAGDAYAIGNYLLRTGDRVSVHTANFAGAGRCIGLTPVSNVQQKDDFVSKITQSVYYAQPADSETEGK